MLQVVDLLTLGALVNARDSMLRTPLLRAALSGHLEIATTLLSCKADPQSYDKDGW